MAGGVRFVRHHAMACLFRTVAPRRMGKPMDLPKACCCRRSRSTNSGGIFSKPVSQFARAVLGDGGSFAGSDGDVFSVGHWTFPLLPRDAGS